ncbi:hypothetical protein IQ06DRAFT_373273 [Phaeosphaeriaceae sp. SRC1lsM3a]|nr:hypothetical protein IQ06DRAFT_373273 [Stagonospora sp. SRC1lsM3a]
MSTRRSGRAKAPVKYTSDSEGSDYGSSKTRKSNTKSTPEKRTNGTNHDAVTSSPAKRTKKDPSVVAAEHRAKAAAADEKASKAAHKKAWDEWVTAHDVGGKLLDDEPAREESITQTDGLKKYGLKKYGLKKEDLAVLKHFEKKNPNPLFKNAIKLFFEEEVKVLGYRKAGMLAGVEGKNEEVLKQGEEIWREEHKDDPPEEEKEEKKKAPKEKTPKQKWTAYLEAHAVSSPDSLKDEPEEAINQTDCKTKYSLVPGDLVVLPYFPKPNPKYGNTTKLFKESEVKTLAYRKAAVLGGVEDGDEAAMLEKGKELFEEK